MNTYTLYTLRPGKSVWTPSSWRGKGTPPLSVVYELIGTDIVQQVPYFTQLTVNPPEIRTRGTCWCDEEGLLKRRPLNIQATKLWRLQYPFATELCGPICIWFKEPKLADPHRSAE